MEVLMKVVSICFGIGYFYSYVINWICIFNYFFFLFRGNRWKSYCFYGIIVNVIVFIEFCFFKKGWLGIVIRIGWRCCVFFINC